MAKTYLSVVKYLVASDFEIDGIVNKHDIIGAVFGQSEGLVGKDLDLKELQSSGKIGIIDVKYTHENGKTVGSLVIPSSMNMVETAVVGAAIETVEKVGPYTSKFQIKEIKDVRAAKREHVERRAKELLERMIFEQIPDSRELVERVSQKIKISDVLEDDGITYSPAIEDSNEVILVEGRADVLNLLKNGIKNVASFVETKDFDRLRDLTKRKKITVFVDGDRGGDLSIKKLLNELRLDYITKAPSGKEVEELTKKEILSSLKHKLKAADFLGRGKREKTNEVKRRQRTQERTGRISVRTLKIPLRREDREDENLKKIRKLGEKVRGEMTALIFDKSLKLKKEVSIDKLQEALERESEVYAIAMDGIITKRIVDKAREKGLKYIVGVKSRLKKDERDIVISLF